MALSNVQTPYDTLTDQNGYIIGSGTVFIGVSGMDPETNPVAVYWDSAGTNPASQPLQVINGYICNTGTPAQVFVDSDYSIRLYSGATIVYTYLNILVRSISGTAGGDLIGNYPNPTIRNNVVSTAKIIDKAVTNAKINPAADNTVKGSLSGNTVDFTAYQLQGILGRVGEKVEFTHSNWDTTLFIWANGQTLNRTTDARLFAKVSALLGTQGAKGWGVGDGSTTFVAPDYRGYFDRAFSDVGGVDPDAPGRVLGTDQLDAMQGHIHTTVIQTAPGSGSVLRISDVNPATPTNFNSGDPISDGINGTPRISTETRSINVTSYWCIAR